MSSAWTVSLSRAVATLGLCAGAWTLAPGATWAAGKALSLDGVNDSVSVPDRDAFSPSVNDFSLSLWAKIPSSAAAAGNGSCEGAGRYLAAKWNQNEWEWGLENDQNSRLCFSAWQPGSKVYGIVSINRTLNDDRWHHYAVTLDYGVKLVLYIDGVAVATKTSFSGAMGNGSQPVSLGGRLDGNFFVGLLDEVRFYAKALTASEVATHYNAGAGTYGTPEAGLTAGWHFDDGSGTAAADFSGNALSATLVNGPAWVDGFIAPPSGDTTAPVISAVAASQVTATTATITWTTNEGATSQVDYGATTAYGASSPLDAALVTSHAVALTGLTAATLYHYRVRSNDQAGNQRLSADATVTTAATSGALSITLTAPTDGAIFGAP